MTNKKIVYNPIQPEVLEFAAGHGNSPEAILEVLKDIQAEHGGLSRPNITDTARALGIPAHQAYGMATFYSMLSLDERKQVLRVCDGPVCWLKRASVDNWMKKMPGGPRQRRAGGTRVPAQRREGVRRLARGRDRLLEAAQGRGPRYDRLDRQDRSRFD
jgi:hypothetical protein